MLAALGFKRGTRIYLAGAHMYGGEAKMAILKYLYPNIVTKEDILTDEEIAPFRNYSSQVGNLKPFASVLYFHNILQQGKQLTFTLQGEKPTINAKWQ